METRFIFSSFRNSTEIFAEDPKPKKLYNAIAVTITITITITKFTSKLCPAQRCINPINTSPYLYNYRGPDTNSPL